MTDIETSLQDLLDSLAIERLKTEDHLADERADAIKAELLAEYTDEEFATAWLARMREQAHLTLPDFATVVAAVARLRARLGRQV